MKISVYIDDFGAGNTSYDELVNLEISGVKIDSKLLHESQNNSKAASLIRILNDFGHEHDIQIIIEGIESEPDLVYAQDLGCRYGQGFKLSPPFPYEYFINDGFNEPDPALSCNISQRETHPYL